MQNLINQVKSNEVWRHYKGNDYRIIAISCDSENLTWYVVYETLYDNSISKIWHRPLEMFLGTVIIDNKSTARFTRIKSINE